MGLMRPEAAARRGRKHCQRRAEEVARAALLRRGEERRRSDVVLARPSARQDDGLSRSASLSE